MPAAVNRYLADLQERTPYNKETWIKTHYSQRTPHYTCKEWFTLPSYKGQLILLLLHDIVVLFQLIWIFGISLHAFICSNYYVFILLPSSLRSLMIFNENELWRTKSNGNIFTTKEWEQLKLKDIAAIIWDAASSCYVGETKKFRKSIMVEKYRYPTNSRRHQSVLSCSTQHTYRKNKGLNVTKFELSFVRFFKNATNEQKQFSKLVWMNDHGFIHFLETRWFPSAVQT